LIRRSRARTSSYLSDATPIKSHYHLTSIGSTLRVISRRAFLSAVAAAGAVPCRTVVAQRAATRLILLGTAGGPRPQRARAASAQVIVSNNVAYVIDCGDGVARQLVSAGIPLPTLSHIFITHNHSDHNADYGNLIWLAWTAGLRTRVDTWGPPPLERMTKLFFEMNAYDINTRISNEGRVPIAPLVHVHEIHADRVVMSDENVKVTCALVDHPPVVPAFSYRFDARDRSIAISGDTAPSDNLVKLARGADVLVHSVMFPTAIDRLVGQVPNATALKESILAHQTSAEDAGRIAQAAGVKTLVLSHFVPADDPQVTDQMWIDAAQSRFRGTVVLGKDLLEV
jgi:ribonuclease BN (tRNA processing enzyme)